MSLLFTRGSRIYLMSGSTDMRKGVHGLFQVVVDLIHQDSTLSCFCVFRGKRSNILKILYWDGQGFCLFYKRLERGRFIWPKEGSSRFVSVTEGQFAMLLEGIDWRNPSWSAPPEYAS